MHGQTLLFRHVHILNQRIHTLKWTGFLYRKDDPYWNKNSDGAVLFSRETVLCIWQTIRYGIQLYIVITINRCCGGRNDWDRKTSHLPEEWCITAVSFSTRFCPHNKQPYLTVIEPLHEIISNSLHVKQPLNHILFYSFPLLHEKKQHCIYYITSHDTFWMIMYPFLSKDDCKWYHV